ncbi:MAG: hypothetical protein AAF735_01205 [Myxococcota bacterium]
MKEKLSKLLAEYGVIAVVLWYGVFALTWVGFASAIKAGVAVDSAAGTAGVWAGAYLATQVTKPIRLLVVFGLTPVVGKFVKRTPTSDAEVKEVEKAADVTDAGSPE